MNRLWTIVTYEIQRNIRRKGYLIATIGLPLLVFVGLFGFDFYQQNLAPAGEEQQDRLAEQLNLEGIEKAGLIDESGTLTKIPPVLESVIVRYDSIEAARRDLTANEIDLFYVVAEDFLETGDVTLHSPGLQISLFNTQIIRTLFYTNIAADIDPEILSRLQEPATYETFDLQEDTATASSEDADFAVAYIYALVLLGGVFLTNNYLMQSVIEEKENRLIEILVSAATPRQLLGGKILAMGSLGILQITVWVLAILGVVQLALQLPTYQGMSFFVSISLPVAQLPILLVFFILGYLMFAAVYGIIGAISNSMREAPQYAAFILVPAMFPMYVIGVFAEAPNSALPMILSYFPLTSPLAMIMRVLLAPVPPVQILLSLGLLVLTVLGLLWLAGRVFRAQMLLSGQTPGIRELINILLGRTEMQPQRTSSN